MQLKKVENPCVYWKEIDSNYSYYIVNWTSQAAKDFLQENQAQFIHKYVLLTKKYGILMPVNINMEQDIELQVKNLVELDTIEYPDNWIKFCYNKLNNNLQLKKLTYSFYLFVKRGDKVQLEHLVNSELLFSLDKVLADGGSYAHPFVMDFSQDHFFMYYESNAFFYYLGYDTDGYRIDNSEFAYLNATRFNSFLRDFYYLCFEYGATDLKYGDYEGDNPRFSVYGVIFNNEVIYYEDVFEMLPQEHRYQPFKDIQVDIDKSHYENYQKKISEQ